jgi:hypothetical protein
LIKAGAKPKHDNNEDNGLSVRSGLNSDDGYPLGNKTGLCEITDGTRNDEWSRDVHFF